MSDTKGRARSARRRRQMRVVGWVCDFSAAAASADAPAAAGCTAQSNTRTRTAALIRMWIAILNLKIWTANVEMVDARDLRVGRKMVERAIVSDLEAASLRFRGLYYRPFSET